MTGQREYVVRKNCPGSWLYADRLRNWEAGGLKGEPTCEAEEKEQPKLPSHSTGGAPKSVCGEVSEVDLGAKASLESRQLDKDNAAELMQKQSPLSGDPSDSQLREATRALHNLKGRRFDLQRRIDIAKQAYKQRLEETQTLMICINKAVDQTKADLDRVSASDVEALPLQDPEQPLPAVPQSPTEEQMQEDQLTEKASSCSLM